jgi:arsenate reductase
MLERILAMVGDPVAEMVRKDKRFDELKLKAADYTTKDAVVEVLLKYPELMQRPIVIHDRRAIIARPADKVAALF